MIEPSQHAIERYAERFADPAGPGEETRDRLLRRLKGSRRVGKAHGGSWLHVSGDAIFVVNGATVLTCYRSSLRQFPDAPAPRPTHASRSRAAIGKRLKRGRVLRAAASWPEGESNPGAGWA